jgi:uncharacterized delta-60 repeat protein
MSRRAFHRQRRPVTAHRCAPAGRFACEPLERRTLLSAGDLDSAFGVGGVATVPLPVGHPGDFYVTDLAIQQDEKSVVVGNIITNIDYAVRFTASGGLDTSFGGGDGIVNLRNEGGGFGFVAGAEAAADGTLVIAGTTPTFGNQETWMLVARLLPDGSRDPSFGGGAGFVTTEILPPDVFASRVITTGLALQADGKIVVLGTVPTYRNAFGDDDFVVVRYNPDGSLDTAFGDDGIRLIDFEGEDFSGSVEIDYTGNFATNPYWGSIVVSGSKTVIDAGHIESEDFAVARLTPRGDPDNSFDDNGKLITRFPGADSFASALVPQGGGRIVAVGYKGPRQGPHNFAMVRYLPDGSLDPSFGYDGTGRVEIDFDGSDDEAFDAAKSFLGGIVAVGPSGGQFGIAVFTPDGQLDNRFSGDGRVKFDPGTSRGAAAVEAAPGRKLVVGGGNKVARLWDVASVITIGTLNPRAFEAGPTPTSFVVARTERLPYAERVFLNVGGTALRPGNFRNRPPDYTASGMTFGRELSTEPTYVDIPANQTFTTVTVTPNDDTAVEGDEIAVFSIAPYAFYDAGAPWTTTIVIVDNEAAPVPQVVGRHLFYDGSAFDAGGEMGADPDDAAIATDKRALLPGESASAANATGYARGINGLMVDISNLPGDGGGVTAAAFEFRAGAGADPAGFEPVPPPQSLTVRANAGVNGSDRVVVTWPAGTLRNRWLRARVLATAATGLAAPDVFYFGSLVGDTADSDTVFRVNALDLAAVKRDLNQAAAVTTPTDVDRNARVNALDLGTIKQNLNRSLPTLFAPSALPTTLLAPLPEALSGFATARPTSALPRRPWEDPPEGLLN